MQYSLWYVVVSGNGVPPLPDHRPATYWVQHTTSCIAQPKAPEDGQSCCPKHVELNWIYTACGMLWYLVTEFHRYQITDRQRIGCNIPQAVLHSLKLLKMGKIVARNMSS